MKSRRPGRAPRPGARVSRADSTEADQSTRRLVIEPKSRDGDSTGSLSAGSTSTSPRPARRPLLSARAARWRLFGLYALLVLALVPLTLYALGFAPLGRLSFWALLVVSAAFLVAWVRVRRRRDSLRREAGELLDDLPESGGPSTPSAGGRSPRSSRR